MFNSSSAKTYKRWMLLVLVSLVCLVAVQAIYVDVVQAQNQPPGSPSTEASANRRYITVTFGPTANADGYSLYEQSRHLFGDDNFHFLRNNFGHSNVVYYDYNVTFGQSYSYYAEAWNYFGSSSPSNTATAQLIPLTPPSPTARPTKRYITITWNPVEQADTYSLYKQSRDAFGDDDFHLIRNYGSNIGMDLIYTDYNVRFGQTYSYYVVAGNNAGTSQPSGPVSSQLIPLTPPSPAAVVNNDHLTITWSPADSADRYSLYKQSRYIFGDDGFHLIRNYGSNIGMDLIYNDYNVTGGKTFSYYVIAGNDAGDSMPSDIASATMPGNDGDANAGVTSCNAHVGAPVNVTDGNMYLQQTDYRLPGIGNALDITRTYNSSSQHVNLFGRGWSSAYDESIQIYASNLLRLYLPDGRGIYFTRSGGALTPQSGDFRGQLMQNGDNSYTLSFPDGSLHRFSASGKLLSLADGNTNQTLLTYDANSKLSSITDPFGRVMTVTSDGNGHVISISDALGIIATYAYGSSNELLSVTYADDSKYQFAYAGFPNPVLTTVQDALGNVIESHSYDGQGRATTSEKQGSVEHVSLNYISNTETDVTDALGHVTKYTFDKSRDRNVVTRVEGTCSCGSSQSQTWTYDNQLNVTAKTNALGQTVTYTYDAQGNRLTSTDALGTNTYTYNEFGQALTVTDPMNGVTTNTYDAQGNVLTTKNALNQTTTFTYDAQGHLLTVTDPRGNVAAFAYDAAGNLVSKTDAANNVTTFAYDARGRLTSATNALNQTTAYAYDAAGRVNKVTQPDNSFVTVTYDSAGRRTKTTDARGHDTSYAYDGAYRLTSETNAANQTTSRSYDAMSNLTGVTDALGRTTNYEYDEFNRLKKTIYPAATTGATRLTEIIEYDAGGNVTHKTDTAGRVTNYEYDAANRLHKTIDPAIQATQYEYNARSEMTALTDAANQRYTFAYDSVGHITGAARGGVMTVFAYDAAGNRTQRTDYNGASTNYTYDALNRLASIAYPDSTSAIYAYDQLSRLQTATNVNGTVTLNYNNGGQVSNVVDVFGQSVNYGYDANGNRTNLSVGQTTGATYQYDALNRLTQLADGNGSAFTFGYDATNKLTSRSAPNGITSTYNYDGLNQLTRLTHAAVVSALADYQYQQNTAGQITQIAEATGTHNFAYDAANRLTSATHPSQQAESYGYDGVGNRTASQQSSTYSYQPFNKLASTSTASYSYDNNGNLTAKTDSAGTWQYVWDYENRLTQVTRPDNLTINYKYDALGRRIQRSKNGTSTNYIYDGQDVVKDINSDGSTVDYLNGLGVDNKLRQTSAAGTLYFMQDQLGSTHALTDTNGNVVEQEQYDSFGDGAGSSLTRYGYTGRERDADTGLYYYRARWYDPQAGRFLSEDPIGFGGGANFYAYVGNNPVNATDPLGLYNIDVHYYLTYFIATRFSCLTKDEARLIADADQSTDENDDTSPGPGWTARQRKANSDYHAFNKGNNGNLANLRNNSLSGNSNYVGLGMYLHYLQDSYSHKDFSNSYYGQAGSNGTDYPIIGGLVVDNTNHDVGKAAQMASATWFAIRDWIKAKKCKCGDQGDTNVNSWWPQVMEFLKTDNSQLERKRQILGIPSR